MERKIWLFSALGALFALLVAGCGSTTPYNRANDPWDEIKDPPDLRASFERYWVQTQEASQVVVMAKGEVTVGCGYGNNAGLDAMAACKRSLACFKHDGAEHSVELFYSNGLAPLADESVEERKVCAVCVCLPPPRTNDVQH